MFAEDSLQDLGIIAGAEKGSNWLSFDVIVDVDDWVEELGVVMALDAEGLGHEGRV